MLITGDRNWTNRAAIKRVLQQAKSAGYDTLIEGEARGADSIAKEEATRLGYIVRGFPANWAEYHRAAGYIRNQQMLDEGQPDTVVYFHKNLAESKGTADMVRRARKAGITVINGEIGQQLIWVR